MKSRTTNYYILVLLFLVGCSGTQPPITPTVVVPSRTATVRSTSTTVATETFIPPATSTMTLEPTLVVNPENLELAETGYDVADVRYSYPREDILVIDFKYRLDKSRTSKDTYIFMTIPPKCKGNDYQYFPPYYVANGLSGDGQFSFKMTLQGVCDADSLEFTFHHALENPHPPLLYSEYVLQPYHLVRSFPTLNSDTIEIKNFQFTPQGNWGGVFTFDYAISEEIPLSLENYSITLRSFGPDGGCSSYSNGPLITEHKGTYQISLYLPQQLLYPYKNCLKGLKKYTYTQSALYVNDTIGGTSVYYYVVNLPYTVWKSP